MLADMEKVRIDTEVRKLDQLHFNQQHNIRWQLRHVPREITDVRQTPREWRCNAYGARDPGDAWRLPRDRPKRPGHPVRPLPFQLSRSMTPFPLFHQLLDATWAG